MKFKLSKNQVKPCSHTSDIICPSRSLLCAFNPNHSYLNKSVQKSTTPIGLRFDHMNGLNQSKAGPYMNQQKSLLTLTKT